MENLKIGRWILMKDAILGFDPNDKEIRIDEDLYHTKRYKDQIVWDWPIHFVEKLWSVEQDALDLLTLIRIAGYETLDEDPETLKIIDENTVREIRTISEEKCNFH